MNHDSLTKMIQFHLFRHPVYRWTADNESDMCVLVTGDTEYAQVFVDLCLQTGQMYDRSLHIFWCIKDAKIKDTYLEHRPGFREFISIDGEAAANGHSYSSLSFVPAAYYLEEEAIRTTRYLFAAGEEDAENEETAAVYQQMSTYPCLASYVAGGAVRIMKDEADEVFPDESMDLSEEELKRLAFNAHMIWEGKGNLDIDRIRERFEEPYNYDSSVSLALSIPYKLRSIGIYEQDPFDAAEKMFDVVRKARSDPDSEEAVMLTRLALLEHRRWVIEKASQGTVRLTDKNGRPEYASCADRKSVKKMDTDGHLLMHPCMVDGTEKTPLKTGRWKDHRLWDDAKVRTDELDDLDRMSVELHRAMNRAAKQVKNDRSALSFETGRLKDLCWNGSEQLKQNFGRYHFCIENILDKSMPYAAQFETYEKMLTESLSELAQEEKDAAAEWILNIRDLLFPVIESDLYRDYKDYDIQFIEQLPYILTAKLPVHLCLPLGEANDIRNNNDDHFRSVASATALYADKVTYLYVYDHKTNLQVLESKLKAIHNYFYLRGHDCEITLICFTKEGEREDIVRKIEKILSTAEQEDRLHAYRLTSYRDEQDLREKVTEAVRDCGADYFDGTNPLTASNMENGRIYREIATVVPYFEFDSYHKRFENCVNCGHLKYAEISTFIQVEDMFALLNARDKEFNYQDYADCYEELWSIYCGDAVRETDFALCARSWSKLCTVLRSGGGETLSVNEDIGTDNVQEIRVIKAMLQALYRKGYLKYLMITDDKTVSCTIRDTKIKRLFLKAGDLLEIYVFFEAMKTGYFDDIQTGYRFKWEFDDVTNELDCVLTKGYRSILAECKSTKSPDENFYLTIDSLGDHFGIGYKKVLIMVTDVQAASYEQYRSRGNLMDIITLSTKSDLMDIGKKLVDIMEM